MFRVGNPVLNWLLLPDESHWAGEVGAVCRLATDRVFRLIQAVCTEFYPFFDIFRTETASGLRRITSHEAPIYPCYDYQDKPDVFGFIGVYPITSLSIFF